MSDACFVLFLCLNIIMMYSTPPPRRDILCNTPRHSLAVYPNTSYYRPVAGRRTVGMFTAGRSSLTAVSIPDGRELESRAGLGEMPTKLYDGAIITVSAIEHALILNTTIWRPF